MSLWVLKRESAPVRRPRLHSPDAPCCAQPAAAPPTPSAKTLTPSDGYVYIVTRSGKTYCQVTSSEVDCEAPFTSTPFVNGMRANGVRFTADGKAEWVSGDLGDIPVVSIDYDTYRALSWTIVATHAGTTFTHTNGHSIFVSLDNVDPHDSTRPATPVRAMPTVKGVARGLAAIWLQTAGPHSRNILGRHQERPGDEAAGARNHPNESVRGLLVTMPCRRTRTPWGARNGQYTRSCEDDSIS
jgi:hypothetical protein